MRAPMLPSEHSHQGGHAGCWPGGLLAPCAPGSKGRAHPAEEHSRGSIWVKLKALLLLCSLTEPHHEESQPRSLLGRMLALG